MSLVKIILAVLLPPLAVLLERGIGTSLLLNILLTMIGFIPGVIHAVLVMSNAPDPVPA